MIRRQAQRLHAKVIAEQAFLSRKVSKQVSKQVSRMLKECPDIGKVIKNYVEEAC